MFAIFNVYSPFLHYPLVPSFKKINIVNTGNQNPPEGGTWLPVFPVLIFVSRKPADNAKMVNIISALNLCNRHDGQTHQSMPTEVIAVKTRKSIRFYDFVELNGLSFLGIQVELSYIEFNGNFASA